jgi:hypothetical protein
LGSRSSAKPAVFGNHLATKSLALSGFMPNIGVLKGDSLLSYCKKELSDKRFFKNRESSAVIEF